MGRRATFEFTAEEREVLERWARRPKSAQALALRCRIVLATVSKWRGRFREERS